MQPATRSWIIESRPSLDQMAFAYVILRVQILCSRPVFHCCSLVVRDEHPSVMPGWRLLELCALLFLTVFVAVDGFRRLAP